MYLYQRIINYQSLNNYLDYLDNNTKENELVDQFSIAMSMKQEENNQIISIWCLSFKEFNIKLKCPCDKCNVKRKLLKEKLKRFEEISEAYNRHNNYRVTIIISEVWDQLKHNVGKFDINVTKQGDNPCLNNPYIYEDLVAHETYNNYIDYLENEMAEENKMVDPFST